MELRQYQNNVLNELHNFLDLMREKQAELDEYNEFLVGRGKEPVQRNIAEEAWRSYLPSEYINQVDGRGLPIPHVCLKVPTGGGKTLLASYAVRKINHHYFQRNTGLVLWVVPSDAIYKQTITAFRNPDHPYRKVLDRAAPRRRVKILERQSNFAPSDIFNNLSVMVLMMQAAGRENKETLRMFRDNGNLMDFFPSSNNYAEHQKLLEEYPNLDMHEQMGKRIAKCSLGNVLRIVRPIIVLDEGHTATSYTRRETFNQFNPRFILELTATPPKEHSNVLVNVTGQTLKTEEMIKLPIQIRNSSDDDWKAILSDACERLKDIGKQAVNYQSNIGRYIRPIMLVRVENTGKEQRGKGTIHSEDVRHYLTSELGFHSDEVRVKSSSIDEIANENLLSPSCPVRVVITKDALKEGWDCPFAYVLALLDSTRSSQTLTQMIGRVLRQPYAQQTNIDNLDTAHIFCFNQDVGKMVKQIQGSLENHGLGDMSSGSIYVEESKSELIIERRKQFRGQDILMPQVFHSQNGKYRPIDYEQGILAEVQWEEIQFDDKQGNFFFGDQAVTEGRVDIDESELTTEQVIMEGEATTAFFARNLADIIPNPWQAMRVVQSARYLIDSHGSPQDVYNDRMNIVRKLRANVLVQVEQKKEAIFTQKIDNKEFLLDLDASNSNWKVPQSIVYKYLGDPKYLARETNEQLELGLFQKYAERDFNEFEKKVACYLDEGKALQWWHRVAARREYGLQGWRKHMVYPDFLALISKDNTSLLMETKGSHLANNDDTTYKKKLFELLERSHKDVGNITVSGLSDKIMLRIIYDKGESVWEEELDYII